MGVTYSGKYFFNYGFSENYFNVFPLVKLSDLEK